VENCLYNLRVDTSSICSGSRKVNLIILLSSRDRILSTKLDYTVAQEKEHYIGVQRGCSIEARYGARNKGIAKESGIVLNICFVLSNCGFEYAVSRNP
jgi:hypothetical protein